MFSYRSMKNKVFPPPVLLEGACVPIILHINGFPYLVLSELLTHCPWMARLPVEIVWQDANNACLRLLKSWPCNNIHILLVGFADTLSIQKLFLKQNYNEVLSFSKQLYFSSLNYLSVSRRAGQQGNEYFRGNHPWKLTFELQAYNTWGQCSKPTMGTQTKQGSHGMCLSTFSRTSISSILLTYLAFYLICFFKIAKFIPFPTLKMLFSS